MRIIPNYKEKCFNHEESVLVRTDFVDDCCGSVGLESLGLYLTIVFSCGTKGYTDFDTLKSCCKESPSELLEWLNVLETNGFIKIEEV